MAFEVTYEAAAVMRDLAKKIPCAVEGIHQANVEVIHCYESVKQSIGPHTRMIEAIVRDIERLLKKNAEGFSAASNSLNQQADRVQIILDSKHKFRDELKVGFTPVALNGKQTSSATGDPSIGALNRNRGNQTEYEEEK